MELLGDFEAILKQFLKNFGHFLKFVWSNWGVRTAEEVLEHFCSNTWLREVLDCSNTSLREVLVNLF